jgi:hypothetical protein
MKRFLILSGLLFLVLTFWTSFASAVSFITKSEAAAGCEADRPGFGSRHRCTEAPASISVNQPYEGFYSGCFNGTWGDCYATRYTWSQAEPPPGPNCTSDVLSDVGGSGSSIRDFEGCAYTCGVNYDLLDGNTSFNDAHQCTGLAQEFIDSEPANYTDPNICAVRSNTGTCLELAQQSGPCAAGTTYGRVNDIEVCVPSGTSTAATDEGSTGVPDAGGSQQATGTADSAGTGGLSTGSGTSTGSSSSTTTDNGDGTSTTTGESTEESSGPATFGGHGDPASWWVSKYPEGAAGIGQNFSETIQASSLMGILSPLDTLPEGGSAPVWSMNFNLGPMGNFGSMSYELPNGFWLFIKFCVLFTAAMTCRALIFGG